jgi:hypothetical protein
LDTGLPQLAFKPDPNKVNAILHMTPSKTSDYYELFSARLPTTGTCGLVAHTFSLLLQTFFNILNLHLDSKMTETKALVATDAPLIVYQDHNKPFDIETGFAFSMVV